MASGELVKKVAGCHQFHAVPVTVEETMRAARVGRVEDARSDGYKSRQSDGKPGDNPIGVVRHAQGSSKRLTMAF